MHSLPYEGGATGAIHRAKMVNPIRKGIDKNGFITQKSAKRDIFLPPINKQTETVSLANLDTAKGWSHSTKELIAKEWDNLERIKKRGSLASKYTVLPPINHNMNNNSNKEKDSIFNANNLKLMFQSIESKECSEERPHEHLQKTLFSSEKELPHTQSKRRSKRKDRRRRSQKNNGEKELDKQIEEQTTVDSSKTLKEEHIFEKSITPQSAGNKSKKGQIKEQQAPPQLMALPKVPSPSVIRKKNGPTFEQEYGEQMAEWARQQGRRHAICYEMDPLFRELTSIIKYNLLVQHLEDIWMCWLKRWPS